MSAQPVTAESLHVLSDEATREKRAATGRYIQVGVCAVIALAMLGSLDDGGGLALIFVVLAIVFGVNGGTHSRRARDLNLQVKLATAQAGADTN